MISLSVLISNIPMQDCDALAVHLWWHMALYYIELGKPERALLLYDSAVRKGKTIGVLDLVDASSLLFRLQVAGVDVGDRCDEVVECWRPRLGDNTLVFNDLHFLMATVGSHQP